jgi:Uma2 family endonuclease
MGSTITLRYAVAFRDDWALPEEPVPESQPHDLAVELLKALLVAWVARAGLDAQVARNLAFRWVEERPQIGVDPDVCLIAPRTPEGEDLDSLCTWKPGHSAPALAIEVVSASNARKDYATAPERYAASGARELWIFDPRLAGPKSAGGPHRLQIWRRSEDDAFERVYAGEGPARSPELQSWLFVVDEGSKLRIADDAEGTSWWTTAEEAERAAKEAERAAKEAALARVSELEAELRRRG